MVTNGLNFDYDEDAWCLELGFQLGRLEFAFGNRNFQDDLGNEVARVETELMEYLYSQLSSHGIDMLPRHGDFGALIGDIFRKVGGRRTSLILIGVAAFRVGLIDASNDAESNSLMPQTARSSLQGIPDVHLPDREALFNLAPGPMVRPCPESSGQGADRRINGHAVDKGPAGQGRAPHRPCPRRRGERGSLEPPRRRGRSATGRRGRGPAGPHSPLVLR